jgi:hypothetical protein
MIGHGTGSSVPGGADAMPSLSAALERIPATVLTADGATLYDTDLGRAWERLGVATGDEERLANLGRAFERATYAQSPVLFAPVMDLDRARDEIGFRCSTSSARSLFSRRPAGSSSPT